MHRTFAVNIARLAGRNICVWYAIKFCVSYSYSVCLLCNKMQGTTFGALSVFLQVYYPITYLNIKISLKLLATVLVSLENSTCIYYIVHFITHIHVTYWYTTFCIYYYILVFTLFKFCAQSINIIGPPKRNRKQRITNENNRSLSFHFNFCLFGFPD